MVSAERLGVWIDNLFAPGRYDGARQARPLAFVDSCSCYRYSGYPIEVP